MKGCCSHRRTSVVPLVFLLTLAVAGRLCAADDRRLGGHEASGERLVSPSKLAMFVDDLPDMPRLRGYKTVKGVPVPGFLSIGMFEKKWRFHRDLPWTRVFAFGKSRKTATVPGPTIESMQGTTTRVMWSNHLPDSHILPWDPTIPTAVAVRGVPTVVHLHGAIADPTSDGNSMAWFTAGFNITGSNWSKKIYEYPNVQHPGNLWYHDHAMGLTRVNLLAGLVGVYVIRNPELESPLQLPSGEEFDRILVVFDRSFRVDGSIYMNATGDNPKIHPQWQPEYFGDAIIVNGKAWPKMKVQRRKYRFRILNASNARFFRFYFANSTLRFIHVGSDSMYLSRPSKTTKFLLAPSEMTDVVVDFSKATSEEVVLANDAPFPFPKGDSTNDINGKVMKFVIQRERVPDYSSVPRMLLSLPKPDMATVTNKRFISMNEYESKSKEPTHLYLNGLPFTAPVTDTPKVGATEVWEIINLTDDNHPFHVHLGLFVVLDQRRVRDLDDVRRCLMAANDASRCRVEERAVGKRTPAPRHESGWKNVYKMRPGYLTRILVRFSTLLPDSNSSHAYPFDATVEPGYVYHCHILDHEDNEMMRPFKLIV